MTIAPIGVVARKNQITYISVHVSRKIGVAIWVHKNVKSQTYSKYSSVPQQPTYKKGMRICKRNNTLIKALLCMLQCRWSLAVLSLNRQVRESTCDLWWMKWHWDRFFSKYFDFPVSIIPAMHHIISLIYDQCYKTLATGRH
jgi:hypothetical protein